MLSLFLGITLTNAQSVGIKNTLEDPNIPYDFPASSASLDTYFSKRGVLIPKYDLKELNNPKSPVDFTADITAGKNVNGTMIFNTGTTYGKGYYIWIVDRWHLVLHKGNETQQLSIKIPGRTTLIPANKGTAENNLSSFNAISNNIAGASVSSNSITLPAGKYSYKYVTDVHNQNPGNGIKGTYFNNTYNTYSIKSYLKDANTGNAVTDTQHTTKITSYKNNDFLFYQGMFIFELTSPTTIQQVFQYDDGASSPNLELITRTDFTAVISRVSK